MISNLQSPSLLSVRDQTAKIDRFCEADNGEECEVNQDVRVSVRRQLKMQCLGDAEDKIFLSIRDRTVDI